MESTPIPFARAIGMMSRSKSRMPAFHMPCYTTKGRISVYIPD